MALVMKPKISIRERVLRRRSALMNKRSTWEPTFKRIARNIYPEAGRWDESDTNKGDDNYVGVYDNSPAYARSVLSAGLMGGMTSPARPWFRIATQDRKLMEYDSVKQWLWQVTETMRAALARTNVYRALHMHYDEMGSFGTACTLWEPDPERLLHFTPLTIGEYWFSTDQKQSPNTLYRECQMTVEHIVDRFGYNKASQSVQLAYNDGYYDRDISVLHAVEPRKERDPARWDVLNMPWRSVYLELGNVGGGNNPDGVLRESGYNDMPALISRWRTVSQKTWGNGPGHMAINDAESLQTLHLDKARAQAYQANPPTILPASAKNSMVDLLPGGTSFLDGVVQSAFKVDLDVTGILMDIQDHRQRINNAFYVELFLMMMQDSRAQPATAREVAERHEEKLIMLGPMLEQQHFELLGPLIDIAFVELLQSGMFPPPPRELQGQELKIEFVSTLAQAMRAVGIGAVDRMIGTINVLAGMKPEVLDKLDADQVVDIYADMLAVDPSIVVSDDRVGLVREGRAQQQAIANAAAVAPALAKAELDSAQAQQVAGTTNQFMGYGP